MKNCCAILSIALVAAAATQAHAQAIQLRYTPSVGQVTRYRLTSRMWASTDTSGAPGMQVMMFQTQTVLPMDGANYVVKTVFDSTVMAGGGGGRPDMLRGMAVTVHQDARGHVITREVTPPPGMPPFVANMMTKSNTSSGQNSKELPEGSISPGYTWTDSMPMSVGSGRHTKQVMCHLTYKFERVDHQGGARVAVMSATVSSAAGEACSGGGETVFDIGGSRFAHSTMDMTVATGDGQSHIKTLLETLP
jgi:hypothetical protein